MKLCIDCKYYRQIGLDDVSYSRILQAEANIDGNLYRIKSNWPHHTSLCTNAVKINRYSPSLVDGYVLETRSIETCHSQRNDNDACGEAAKHFEPYIPPKKTVWWKRWLHK